MQMNYTYKLEMKYQNINKLQRTQLNKDLCLFTTEDKLNSS